MLLTRKITAAFIAIFLIGIAVGSLVTVNFFTDTRLSQFIGHTSDPDSMAARINQNAVRDYQLTPEEQGKITPLNKEMAQHLYQLRHQFAVDIISTLDEYHEKIAAQMTPSQREAYEKANGERKKRIGGMLYLDQDSSPAQGQK
jgi:hypothetical protein